jgi:hypothetical protein
MRLIGYAWVPRADEVTNYESGIFGCIKRLITQSGDYQGDTHLSVAAGDRADLMHD